ncbi:cleavage and polyadenylation specificity factor subunit 2 [Clydaea vesicula]|uniref:Cleavage and polyadenylation specificity factor subunit 2 n=1 Tax=Clydaea vesicula TaxID=447962 RepID=A0AAD5XVZ1_9FUNG|nr:cleavage and polyadenylation specificity factor subunit 2 [Clydaea vesicula]
MSYIKFTSYSGAVGDEGPLCYLLEIDEAKILLDCGSSESFKNDEIFDNLKKIVPKIDAVLLSHPDLKHLGAFPLLHKFGLKCPCYATIPVHNQGSMALVEAYQSLINYEEFELFNLSDIDNSFDKIIQLRYSQPVILQGRNVKGITVTAHPAGHTIGGTVWKIVKDTDQIVYAVDYNHKKEQHLNGTILHLDNGILSRPSILITDSYNNLVQQPGRKERDKLLLDSILNNLTTTTSTILLPIETTTRILEVAYLLEQHWATHQLSHPIIWLAYTSDKSLNYAKSTLEWMSERINTQFSEKRDNPFELRNVKCVQNIKELSKFSQMGRIVLTSMASPVKSMDHGFSHILLQQLGTDPDTLVILTDRGSPDSLCRSLYKKWESELENNEVKGEIKLNMEVDFVQKEKIPLQGAELENYKRAEIEKNIIEDLMKKKEEVDELDSDSDLEEEILKENLKFLNNNQNNPEFSNFGDFQQNQYDIHLKDNKKKNQFGSVNASNVIGTSFFKHSNRIFKMFPVVEKRLKYDDYGEIFDPTIYMTGEFQSVIAQKLIDEEELQDEENFKKKEVFVPSKYTKLDISIKLVCKLIYIDFEGLTDGVSIRNILPQVNPRKLILIHGNAQSTTSLKEHLVNLNNFTKEIFCPAKYECINVSSARNIYQVKLTDSLFSSLRMSKVDDYDLSYIQGIIKFPEIEKNVKIEGETIKTETESQNDEIKNLVKQETKEDEIFSIIPHLDIIPFRKRPFRKPVLVGEIKLSSFNKILQQNGFQTKFKNGILTVNNKLTLRKKDESVSRNDGTSASAGTGGLILEGACDKNFYLVRKLLYNQMAVL